MLSPQRRILLSGESNFFCYVHRHAANIREFLKSPPGLCIVHGSRNSSNCCTLTAEATTVMSGDFLSRNYGGQQQEQHGKKQQRREREFPELRVRKKLATVFKKVPLVPPSHAVPDPVLSRGRTRGCGIGASACVVVVGGVGTCSSSHKWLLLLLLRKF